MGQNTSNIRIVILILGLAILACIALIGLLAVQEKSVPDSIIATLSGAVGGLTGILVRGDQPPAADGGDAGVVESPVLGAILIFVIGFILGALCYANGILVGG